MEREEILEQIEKLKKKLEELNSKFIDFELPKNYDKWLRHIFGDYMQLPPENERVLEHSIAYYNLDKRESLDEVLKKIK